MVSAGDVGVLCLLLLSVMKVVVKKGQKSHLLAPLLACFGGQLDD